MKGWEERRAAANNPVSKQEANVVRKYLDLLPTDKIDVLFGEKFDEKLQELDVKGYKPPAFFRITKDNRLELGLSDTATAENFIHEATHAWLSGLNGKDVKTLRELTRGMKGRQTTIEGGNAVNSSRIFDEGFDLTTPEGMEAATDLVMQRLTERDTGGDTVLDKFVRQIKDLFTALKAFLAKNDLAVPKKVKEFIDKIVDQAEEKYLASKTVEQNAIARTNQQIAAADNNEKVVGFIRSYIRTVDDRYEISTEGLKENADAVEWVEFVHEKANKAGENRTELSGLFQTASFQRRSLLTCANFSEVLISIAVVTNIILVTVIINVAVPWHVMTFNLVDI